MPPLHDKPQVCFFLPVLRSIAAGRECFLIGGSIRDWLLARDPDDFDFATPFDPTPLSKEFAAAIGGHWFFLDEARRQSRVVVDYGDSRLTFDFAPFRSSTLVGDLALRDFTINTLAFALNEEWTPNTLIDIFQGRRDLSAAKLRMCSAAVLRSDPLRILKGLRHCLELGLQIEPETLLHMTQVVPDLRLVAVERIRFEMLRILNAPCEAGFCTRLLMESGVGRYFWGECFSDAESLLVRTRFRCQSFWKILENTGLPLETVLDEKVEGKLSRRWLLQWVFLLRTIHGDCALETARNWAFSRQALRRIEALEKIDQDLWRDFQKAARHRRGLLLWAEQYGPDPLDLLLTMGFHLNHSPAIAVEKILQPLETLLEGGEDFAVSDLVDGHFLQQHCRLREGREIGRVLKALRKAEAYGRVVDQKEAEAFVKAFGENND